jgi:predicted nuclease with TOPRIM domain
VNTNAVLTNLQKDYKDCVAVVDGLIDMRAREELNKEDFQRRMEDAQKEKKRLEELLADTGDQIDKRIKFANEAFEFVEHAMLKFKTGPWEKKKRDSLHPRFEPLAYGQKA